MPETTHFHTIDYLIRVPFYVSFACSCVETEQTVRRLCQKQIPDYKQLLFFITGLVRWREYLAQHFQYTIGESLFTIFASLT